MDIAPGMQRANHLLEDLIRKNVAARLCLQLEGVADIRLFEKNLWCRRMSNAVTKEVTNSNNSNQKTAEEAKKHA